MTRDVSEIDSNYNKADLERRFLKPASLDLHPSTAIHASTFQTLILDLLTMTPSFLIVVCVDEQKHT